MKRRHLFATLVLVGCLFATQPALAQDIVQLNEEGITAFQEGRYEEAASKFREAYSIKPEQTLKKNEAVAWFKAEKCGEALSAADEYLALEPTDETSIGEARAVVVKCKVQGANEAVDAGDLDGAEALVAEAKAQSPDEETAQQIAEIEQQISAERQAAEEERKRALAAEEARRQAEAEASQSSGRSTLGLGLASAGAAIVVGTFVYHMIMATGVAPKFNDVAAAGSDRDEYDRLGKRLETANWLVPTLYAVGAATAGVGAYFWLSSGSETAPQAQAAGALPRGEETGMSFGLAVTGRF